MLYLYTENDDGTVNYYGEGTYDILLSYIEKHALYDYKLGAHEPYKAQGKYWTDNTNSDYLAAKALDDEAKAEADRLAQEEASKPTLAEQLTILQANFAQLQSNYDLVTEALDSLIMEDDSTEAESDSSDSDTNTSTN